MNMKKLVRSLLAVIAVLGVSTSYARADKLQLQKKLSQDVEIRLNNVTITEALEKIGQKAGVKFALSDEAAWKLPQGEATRLSVALSGPLAESMTEMLNVFFMRYAAGDEEITIYPRPELEHILGRPTTRQLELLKEVYTKPITNYFIDEVQTTINQALGQEVLILPIHVHAQLNNFLRQLAGKDPIYEQTGRNRRPPVGIKPPQPEPNEPEPTEYDLPTPITLVQLLSQVLTENEPTNTRWYISGMDFPGQSPEIRVVNSTTFGELRRNQRIDITYRDEQADKILQSLANRAGMQLDVEPRSYLHEYKLSVNMQNVPITQAMTAIARMVGADCTNRGSYMQIRGPGPKTSPTTTPKPDKTTTRTAGEGYVGKISIPMDSGKYYIEFMLREKDLTEELKKLRTEKMEQVLGKPPKATQTPKPEK